MSTDGNLNTTRPGIALLVLVLLMLGLVVYASPACADEYPSPHVEGWMKRSQSYHRFAGSDFAERSQQWQGSLVARARLWRGLSLAVRADTQPQSGEFTFTDTAVWQSVEVLAVPGYRLKETGGLEEDPKTGAVYYRWELGIAAAGGLALELGDVSADRVKVNGHPTVAAGLLYVRDRRLGAYLYAGLGLHQAVNGDALAAMATLHVPLSTEKAALDVDVVWGLMDALRPLAPGEVTRAGAPGGAGIRGQRVVVSVSAQVFAKR